MTIAQAVPTWLPKDLHGTLEQRRDEQLRIAVAPGGFSTAAHVLVRAGARFVTLHEALAPERSIVAVYALRGHLVAVHAPAGALHHGPLGAWLPAARWPERELAERHDLVPLDADWAGSLTTPDADALDRRIRGLDAFVIPYGPVRSGIFEAIQFQIETGGENVPRLQTRPYFKHRGLERRLRGLRPDQAVFVAERVAGIAGVAHACAFSQAVERLPASSTARRPTRTRSGSCCAARSATVQPSAKARPGASCSTRAWSSPPSASSTGRWPG